MNQHLRDTKLASACTALPALVAIFSCQRPDAAGPKIHSPLSISELRTTDSSLAVGNLDSQITGFEGVLETMSDVDGLTKVALLHLTRAQFEGRVSDYERALELGERAVRENSDDGDALLLRARTRSALHRFDESLLDLDHARRLGVSLRSEAGLRASILQAIGRPAEALAVLRGVRDRREDLASLSAEASILGDLGELDAAEALFVRAQYLARDTSPLPIALLYFQQGLMWSRGPRARALYEAALTRLAVHAPAASHLARLLVENGRRDAAIRLVRPFAESSEDPEYAGLLSELLRDEQTARRTTKSDSLDPSGDALIVEAERLRARASSRYEDLVRRHPAAYASHAARFWLGPGADPRRALEAAETNLEVRRTNEGYELALNAALAARADESACRIATLAGAQIGPPGSLVALVALGRERCPGAAFPEVASKPAGVDR